jgi:hypothetical protein
MIVEDGSFRDEHNRVYYDGEAVLRGLSAEALADYREYSQAAFFRDALAAGRIVGTTEEADPALTKGVLADGWAGVLRHERIPFISYPYEWPFGMLKAAALLHLDILAKSIPAGWVLKDATAYNVQWRGARPCFIDVTSFERYRKGSPWVGYRQFCMMFLIPLMLEAYRGIDFRPLLRSNLEGVDPAEAARFFPMSAVLRKGVASHVFLHARLQSAYAEAGEGQGPKAINHSEAMVLGMIDGLRRLVSSLELKGGVTTWSHYDETHSYEDESYRLKQAFVQQHVGKKRWARVWDIGCNTGTFSKLCSPHADQVLSIDGDAMAIEKLYRDRRRDKTGNLTPIVMNLANLSPNQGWRGVERKSLETRGRPDFLLCLALIHHMVISANIPLRSYIEWVRSLGAATILEFVGRDDEMTRKLLMNKTKTHDDYTQENFEAVVSEMFTIKEALPLKGGLRTIYYLEPKG